MMAKPKEIPIDQSPFFKSLLRRTTKLYFTRNQKIRKKLNAKDVYQRQILEICLRLTRLLESLRLSRLFLAERLDVPPDEKLKIKNADFIRYHLECYFIRSTTFNDLMLKLFNRVYQFGLTEKNGLAQKVQKKAETGNIPELLHLLNGLAILTSKLSQIRNKIAHGGYHEDIDLIFIESEELIRKNGTNQALSDEEYISTLKQLLHINILDMYDNEKMMVELILIAFKKLHPVRLLNEKQLVKTK